MLAHWIWLAHRPNLSDWLKWEILQQFGDPEKVYFAESYEAVEGLTREGFQSLMDKDLGEAHKILEACVNKRLHILTIQDGAYPERLKQIADPPLVLYYKGQLPDMDSTAVISVVGTRRASPYGLQAAKRLGYQIGKCGGILVSGMAWGIDAMAMNGALMGGAPVVGVLGCGADQIYPLKNKQLFQDTERYGCILSEFPPESPGLPWHFPRRNRIISGLSDGVLVVEAPQKSGALITAREALDQGRDVFVVPGNIGVASCEGSNSLLRQGAGAVGCGWDILSEYVNRYPEKLGEDSTEAEGRRSTQQSVAEPAAVPAKAPGHRRKTEEKSGISPGKAPAPQGKKEKLSIDKRQSQPYIDINDILQQCNSQEKAIVMALKNGPELVDTVIVETGLKTQDVLSGMTMLEIKGILKRLPGRRICLQEK